VTTTESGERRRPGRPRGQGRINTTVRFSAATHAELRVAADASGRSVSEEVEFRIEDYRRIEVLQDEIKRYSANLEASVQQMKDGYEARVARLEKLSADRLKNERDADERIAEIVAIAVARTLGRSQQ
jgi:TraY domain